MKIRQPWMIKNLCLVGYFFLRALLATIPFKYWRNGPDLRPCVLEKDKNYIYVMWHEYVAVPVVVFGHKSLRILVSQHMDGLIVAEICKHLRMGLVRGSTTRGGTEALRKLLRPGRYRHMAVTPDGPRGPRRQVQPGIIYLAARLGWPIIAVGVGYDRPWRMKSWDRFAIPKPFHRADVVASDPILIPPELDRAGLETYRAYVEQTILAVTEKAELAALTGKRPSFEMQRPALLQETAAA